jgi:hypothetical protein
MWSVSALAVWFPERATTESVCCKEREALERTPRWQNTVGSASAFCRVNDRGLHGHGG